MEAPRPVLAAALAAALTLTVPAAASAQATVDRSQQDDLQTVVFSGTDGPDDVAISSDVEDGDTPYLRFAMSPPPGGNCADFAGDSSECVLNPVRLILRVLGNGGDDALDARGLEPLALAPLSDPVQVEGGAGHDRFTGSPSPDRFVGGAGNDTVLVDGGEGFGSGDRFDGGAGTDTLDVSASAAAHTISLDGAANDWPGSANVLPDVERVLGGAGPDTLTASAGSQTLVGNAGGDTLTGGPGGDALDGGPGDDRILAADRQVDTIRCGTGTDTVSADWNDVVMDCAGDAVTRTARDDDNDGSPHGVDCNDANPRIHPGAGEIPGNRIDEDCSGADAAPAPGPPGPVDRDRDGIPLPADCDDSDPGVRPGARDRPQNGVDEDCAGGDAPWADNPAGIVNRWAAFKRFTRVRALTVRRLPRRAKVQLRCKGRGCPVKRKRLRVRRGRASATRLLKRAKLGKGAVIQIRVTAPGTVGKVVRYKIRRAKLPRKRELCLRPGAKRPRRC